MAKRAITAVRCNPACTGTSGAQYPYSFSFIVIVQELAGVGGNITNLTLTLTSGTGPQTPLSYGQDIITTRAGTARVNAFGTLSFPVSIVDTTVPLVVNIQVQFTDDKGNQVTATAQADVT